MTFPSFILHNKNSKVANLILHGGSKGIDSDFIQKIIKISSDKGCTTLAFNFPYLERGEENSSGEELLEEREALKKMIKLLKDLGYKEINLIGKSLGGIVASYYLSNDRDSEINFGLSILGYVVGDLKLKNFEDKVIVVQGKDDKFGDIEAVRSDLQKQGLESSSLFEIAGADHSYRDEDKNPVYEDEAIRVLFEH